MKKIDKKTVEAIRRSIEWMVENSTTDDDGKIKTTVTLPFFFANELLNNYLPTDLSIPERTRRKAVFLALQRWMKHKKYSEDPDPVVALQHAYNTEIRILKRNCTTYTILMFLNVGSTSIDGFKSFSIIGDSLRFRKWNELTDLDIEETWKEVALKDRSNPILWDIGEDRPHPNISRFSPITLEVNTFGPEAAIEIASDRVDILRSIFNIPGTLGGFSYFRSLPKALSQILPSPIYAIYDENGQKVSIYYTIEKYDYKDEKIPTQRKESINYLLSLFTTKPQPSSSLYYLLNVIRQYQKALDISLPQTAYLAMWQVLENGISLGDTINLNREIEARVSVLVELEPLFKDILHLLTKQRNDLVHSGIFPERGDDIFFILKIITDAVIRSLIHLTHHYPEIAELRDYIRFACLGDQDISRKKRVIEKIIESRKK